MWWHVKIQRVGDTAEVDRVTYERPGMMGNEKFDGAIEVVCHRQHNGSGGTAFGGSPNWPCLSATIPFQEGNEKERNRIAALLKKFIDKEIPYV